MNIKGFTVAVLQQIINGAKTPNTNLHNNLIKQSTKNQNGADLVYLSISEAVIRSLFDNNLLSGELSETEPVAKHIGYIWLKPATSSNPPMITNNEEVKVWDGSAYVDSTPELIAKGFENLHGAAQQQAQTPPCSPTSSEIKAYLDSALIDDENSDGYIAGDMVKTPDGMYHFSKTGDSANLNYVDPNTALTAYSTNWDGAYTEQEVTDKFNLDNALQVCDIIELLANWVNPNGTGADNKTFTIEQWESKLRCHIAKLSGAYCDDSVKGDVVHITTPYNIQSVEDGDTYDVAIWTNTKNSPMFSPDGATPRPILMADGTVPVLQNDTIITLTFNSGYDVDGDGNPDGAWIYGELPPSEEITACQIMKLIDASVLCDTNVDGNVIETDTGTGMTTIPDGAVHKVLVMTTNTGQASYAPDAAPSRPILELKDDGSVINGTVNGNTVATLTFDAQYDLNGDGSVMGAWFTGDIPSYNFGDGIAIAIALNTVRELGMVYEDGSYYVSASGDAGSSPVIYPVSKSGVVGSVINTSIPDITSTGGLYNAMFTQGGESHILAHINTNGFKSYPITAATGVVDTANGSNTITGYISYYCTVFVDSQDRAWATIRNSNSSNGGSTAQGISYTYMRPDKNTNWSLVGSGVAIYNYENNISEVNGEIYLIKNNTVGKWNGSSFDDFSGWSFSLQKHNYKYATLPHPSDTNKVFTVGSTIWAASYITIFEGDLTTSTYTSKKYVNTQAGSGEVLDGEGMILGVWATDVGFQMLFQTGRIWQYNAVTDTIESPQLLTLNPIPNAMNLQTEQVLLSDGKDAILAPVTGSDSYVFIK